MALRGTYSWKEAATNENTSWRVNDIGVIRERLQTFEMTMITHERDSEMWLLPTGDCMKIQATKTNIGSVRGFVQGNKEIQSKMENSASKTK